MRFSNSLPVIVLTLGTPASAAFAQTVTEVRTFQSEVFDTAVLDQALYYPNFDLSLPGPIDELQGDIEKVTLNLSIDWTVELMVTNQSNSTSIFRWDNAMTIMPLRGDCVGYRSWTVQGDTAPLGPGETGNLLIQRSTAISAVETDFIPFCNGNEWPWDELWLWNSSLNGAPLSYNGGNVPLDWVRGTTRAVVTGTFTVDWSPSSLPSISVCDGTSPGSTLVAAGGYENLWLLQPNPFDTFGLLLQSTAASTTVPASGLCVGGGSASVTRLPGSVSQDGAPYLLTYDPLFAGTTQYFQAWARSVSGGTETGECIAVLFP